LEALLERHRIVGVLTQPDRPRGRGRRIEPGPVKRVALARGLPVAQPETLASAEGRAPLEAWRPEALVVVAYGLILPREVLALPPLGCLNIHASLLPRWRGAAPIERAIQVGDTETGVTIMQMDSGLDTGPVLLKRRLAISSSHTAGTLRDELSRLGAAALLEALEGLTQGTLKPTPQSAEGVTYAAKIAKSEARIDWRRDALDIERQIRAFNPWPVAETSLDGEPLRILQGRAEEPDEDTQRASKEPQNASKSYEPAIIVAVLDDFVLVQCGRGRLRVLEVQRPGRRRVSARDYAHGFRLVGRRLG
jgi:methionyl-tRNA formyltransferase